LAVLGRCSQSIDQLVFERRSLCSASWYDNLAAAISAQTHLDSENDRYGADQFVQHLFGLPC